MIKAFTLMEVMIALLISSLVFSMGWYVNKHLQQNLVQQEQRGDSLSELLLFRQAITLDVNQSNYLERIPNGLKCTSAEGRSIVYSFKENEIVRTTDSTNRTFDISVFNYETSMQSTPVSVTSIVNRAVITLEKEKIEFPLIVQKQYAADVLMQWEGKP